MGNSQSALLEKCLLNAVGGNSSLVAFPSNLLYQTNYVTPYNLEYPITPAAVTYPKTTGQVSQIVQCAAYAGVKVQPRSGGHSYANYCLGGNNGSIVVDLHHFQQFSMDNSTWEATVGAGMLLGDLATNLHINGNRAVAHGTCPQVGLGGHATIGGLGPASRIWGALVDHVEEVEIVLSNASVVRASNIEHPDLFFATKGAAAGFGIVTEFVLRTQPDPGEIVDYTFTYQATSHTALAQTFKDWQRFISNPKLTWKLSSQVTIYEGGMTITGEYFGPKSEFDALNLTQQLANSTAPSILLFDNYLELVQHWAQQLVFQTAGGLRFAFASKNLAYTSSQLIPASGIDDLFKFLDEPNKGAALWFLIFDLEAGATNTIPMDKTAYYHRNALFYSQSYAVNLPTVTNDTFNFVTGINNVITSSISNRFQGSYPGYVDPTLSYPQVAYWGTNLPKLEQIKLAVDPKDIFSNPQSVRPATKRALAPALAPTYTPLPPAPAPASSRVRHTSTRVLGSGPALAFSTFPVLTSVYTSTPGSAP